MIFHEETVDSQKVLFPLLLSLQKPTVGACPEPDNIVIQWGSTVLSLLGQYDFNNLGQWDSDERHSQVFIDMCGNHWQWPSLTEIMNIEKNTIFTEFSPICLNNLTFVEYRK